MSYYIFCSRAFNIGLQGEMKKLNGVIEWRWAVESWYRQNAEEVGEMKRWTAKKIKGERVSLDQTYVMHFSVLHFSSSFHLSLSFCCAAFCNLCTNNWFMLSVREREERERESPTQMTAGLGALPNAMTSNTPILLATPTTDNTCTHIHKKIKAALQSVINAYNALSVAQF